MSIASKFSSHAEAVKAGWFSRRHQTRGAHDTARSVYLARMAERHEREQRQLAEAIAYREYMKAAKCLI